MGLLRGQIVEAKTYRELAEKPGIIMYSGEGPIHRDNQEPLTEVVHFIFNTARDGSGAHQAVLVDKNFDIMTNKVMMFANIDEFFGLANYMLRNGIVVTK